MLSRVRLLMKMGTRMGNAMAIVEPYTSNIQETTPDCCAHNPIRVLFLRNCTNSLCSRNSPSHVSIPPKNQRKNGEGKCIRENTALRMKFRGDIRV